MSFFVVPYVVTDVAAKKFRFQALVIRPPNTWPDYIMDYYLETEDQSSEYFGQSYPIRFSFWNNQIFTFVELIGNGLPGNDKIFVHTRKEKCSKVFESGTMENEVNFSELGFAKFQDLESDAVTKFLTQFPKIHNVAESNLLRSPNLFQPKYWKDQTKWYLDAKASDLGGCTCAKFSLEYGGDALPVSGYEVDADGTSTARWTFTTEPSGEYVVTVMSSCGNDTTDPPLEFGTAGDSGYEPVSSLAFCPESE